MTTKHQAPAKKAKPIQQHHFFVSTAFGWSTDENEQKAIEKAARNIGAASLKNVVRNNGGAKANVVRVNLPETGQYWIEDYMPTVITENGVKTDLRVPTQDYRQIRITGMKGEHIELAAGE